MMSGGYLFSVLSMRWGKMSIIAPFRYTALLWALLLGIVIFGEWPDVLALIGAAIIVLSGYLMFRFDQGKSARPVSK